MRYNNQAPQEAGLIKSAETAAQLDHWQLNNMKFRALNWESLGFRSCAEISLITLWINNSKSKKQARQNSSKRCWVRYASFDIEFFREFDPGSGLTLAACITHSSRTVTGLRPLISGGRVSNAWAIYLPVRDNNRKQLLIPYEMATSHGATIKDLLLEDELASD